jgi:hypothetical protein
MIFKRCKDHVIGQVTPGFDIAWDKPTREFTVDTHCLPGREYNSGGMDNSKCKFLNL